MKLTQILGRQHMERMARKHWFIQGKKKVVQTKAEEYAVANGIQVVDAEILLNPSPPKINFDLKLVSRNPLPLNEQHPDFKETPCFIHDDKSSLVGGLNQAQVLTNTHVTTTVPEILLKLEKSVQFSPNAHDQLRKKILLSCVFDAEQKKLPKRKDPLRPAWNFRRDYGITLERKNLLLCNHITGLCDLHLKLKEIAFAQDAHFELPLQAFNKQIKLSHCAEIVAMSVKPLPAFYEKNLDAQLPDLYPLHCTVSIEPQHFYEFSYRNPFSNLNSKFKFAHTAFLHFDGTKVQNLYDLPVSEDQIKGRLLTKAFCIAASEARRMQQDSPVTIQAIQTDGRMFTFAIYQLNTLNVESEDKRNICWISPPEPLYHTCSYVNGRPTLEDYNPAVLLKAMALLSNR